MFSQGAGHVLTPRAVDTAIEVRAGARLLRPLVPVVVRRREVVALHVRAVLRARREARVAHVLIFPVVPKHRIGVARLRLIVERHLEELAIGLLNEAPPHRPAPGPGGMPPPPPGGTPCAAAVCIAVTSPMVFICFARASATCFWRSRTMSARVLITLPWTSAWVFSRIACTSACAFFSSGEGSGGCGGACCIAAIA